jgi:hypothetical protein
MTAAAKSTPATMPMRILQCRANFFMFGSFAFFRGFINHGKFGPASGGGANQKK